MLDALPDAQRDQAGLAVAASGMAVRVAHRRWSGAHELGQQRVLRRRGRRPQHGAETARVAVAQHHAVGEFKFDVVVPLLGRWRGGEQAQAAGHTHVHDQGIGAEPEEQIFASAVNAIDRPSDQATRQIRWNRPAQSAVVYPHRGHFVPLYVRGDTAACRFDFRELRHGTCTDGFVAVPTIP